MTNSSTFNRKLKLLIGLLFLSLSSLSSAKSYFLVTISGHGIERNSEGIIEKESIFDTFDLVENGHANLVEAPRRFVYEDSNERFQSLFDEMKEYTESSGEESGLILVGHSMGVKFAFERFIKLYTKNFNKDPDLIVAIEGGSLDYGFWFNAFRKNLDSKNCHNYFQTMPMSLVQGSPLENCKNQNLSAEVFNSMNIFHKYYYIFSPFITGPLSSAYNHRKVAVIAWEKSLSRMLELLEQ